MSGFLCLRDNRLKLNNTFDFKSYKCNVKASVSFLTEEISGRTQYVFMSDAFQDDECKIELDVVKGFDFSLS